MIEVTGFCDSGHDAQCALTTSSAYLVVHRVMHAVMLHAHARVIFLNWLERVSTIHQQLANAEKRTNVFTSLRKNSDFDLALKGRGFSRARKCSKINRGFTRLRKNSDSGGFGKARLQSCR